MPETSYSGLSRRAFLAVSTGVWLSITTRSSQARTTDGPGLAFDDNALVAATNRIWRYDPLRGTRWELPSPGRVASLATYPDRPGRIVAGLASGSVCISDDVGNGWESRAAGLPSAPVDAVAIAADDPDLIYAALRDDGLWKSEDSGRNWSFAMDRPWQNEAEHDPLTLASVALETGMGGIWIYAGTDAGLIRVPDCFCRWQAVQPGNAMDALASGKAPPTEAPLPEGEPIHALAAMPSQPGTLYAALPSGLWVSSNGGVVWSQLAGGAVTAIAVHPRDIGLMAAVIDGNLKFSRDGGANWAAPSAT